MTLSAQLSMFYQPKAKTRRIDNKQGFLLKMENAGKMALKSIFIQN